MSYVIDDRELSKITYNGTWIVGGMPVEHNNTVSSSTHIGDFFTVSFHGTNIAVFGTFDISSGGVETTYSIDNAAPVTIISQAGSNDTHRQQFWRSNDIAMGDHKLRVNMTKVNNDPQANEGTIWFDYFLVTDSTRSTSSSGSPSPITSQQPSAPSSHEHVGAIVGGSIGGLFFILAAAFLYLFYRRRMPFPTERSIEESFLQNDNRRHTIVQPFRLTAGDTLQSIGGSASATTTSEPSSTANLIVGAPPMVSRKSGVSIRPDTGHSTQASIGNTSNAAFMIDEPLPSSSVTEASLPQDRDNPVADKPRRTHHIHVTVRENAMQASPATATTPRRDEDSEAEPVAVQHVDSGIRATSTVNPEVLAATVELPPVYSPS